MTEPKNNRGSSKQDYPTPWEFVHALEERFGKMDLDLAASAENSKAPVFISEEQNSLQQDWVQAIGAGNGFLNPPFSHIAPWAKKCRYWKLNRTSGRLLLLTAAAIDSNWFAEYVYGHALVIGISPRIKFVGHKDPYPKPLMLSVFGEEPGFSIWRWKK